jgi:deoxyribonuclease IV
LSCKHTIGLHLRLKDTLSNIVQEALSYELQSFQFFLVRQKDHKYILLTEEDIHFFLQAKQHFSQNIFIHSSYWINPATSDKRTFTISKMLLKREIRMAKELEIKYLILHAGSAKGHLPTAQDPLCKIKGIKTLAKLLNSIIRNEHDVTLLLENSAHGKKTIGSDLEDILLLKQELDQPEKLGFCLDTAHAFSYGYELEPIENFIELLDRTMGIKNIKLIHFNDTHDKRGCMLDRHAWPGQGSIGKKALLPFLHHPVFASIPKIIEGPASSRNINVSLFQQILSF